MSPITRDEVIRVMEKKCDTDDCMNVRYASENKCVHCIYGQPSQLSTLEQKIAKACEALASLNDFEEWNGAIVASTFINMSYGYQVLDWQLDGIPEMGFPVVLEWRPVGSDREMFGIGETDMDDTFRVMGVKEDKVARIIRWAYLVDTGRNF